MGHPIGSGCGGCSPVEARGCGAGAAPSQANVSALAERVEKHPCYSAQAHLQYARMHVPVAPACNMQCHYCNRKYDCTNESRPGVTSRVLTPDQALFRTMGVARKLPNLTVLGIAGPGDPLANPERTFKTFALIREYLPDLHLCLSTNGLLLSDYVDHIKSLGVDHVTITINAVDPTVGAELYGWIFWDHRRIKGREAAAILLERQMEGLRALTAAGILCKVNSVLVPGANENHLPEVSRTVRAMGAVIHNVMPLIPAKGSTFGDAGIPAPEERLLAAVRHQCGESGIQVMRHCKQCRADAIGLLGEDRSQEFTLGERALLRLTGD